jgi:hypothetical protein
MQFHMYADDTQVYLPVRLQDQASLDTAISTISECSVAIKNWMQNNYLKLNDDKTELMIITAPSLAMHRNLSVNICDTLITASRSVRNLGVMLDSDMSMKDAVTTMCQKAFFQIHLIYQIRDFITEDAARTLVQTNVTSVLDYCNCLLAGLPGTTIERLQRVQNSAARVIKRASSRTHITPILKELHWLPILHRIKYKVNLLTFKCIHGTAPEYLQELCVRYTPNRSLRSADHELLVVPRYKRNSLGGRSFSAQAATLWNNLPLSLRKEQSLAVFRSKLKTHYFTLAFQNS